MRQVGRFSALLARPTQPPPRRGVGGAAGAATENTGWGTADDDSERRKGTVSPANYARARHGPKPIVWPERRRLLIPARKSQARRIVINGNYPDSTHPLFRALTRTNEND